MSEPSATRCTHRQPPSTLASPCNTPRTSASWVKSPDRVGSGTPRAPATVSPPEDVGDGTPYEPAPSVGASGSGASGTSVHAERIANTAVDRARDDRIRLLRSASGGDVHRNFDTLLRRTNVCRQRLVGRIRTRQGVPAVMYAERSARGRRGGRRCVFPARIVRTTTVTTTSTYVYAKHPLEASFTVLVSHFTIPATCVGSQVRPWVQR